MTQIPAALLALRRAIYTADRVNDHKWRAFLHHVGLLLPLIRAGAIDGFEALAICKEPCSTYFDLDDRQSKFSCQCVLLVIKRVAEEIGPIPKRKVVGGYHQPNYGAAL
jgi:hypothetical protein